MTKSRMLHELIEIGKKQTDIIRELTTRFGEKMTPSEFGTIMSGKQQGAKADRVKIEVDQIINSWKGT